MQVRSNDSGLSMSSSSIADPSMLSSLEKKVDDLAQKLQTGLEVS